MDSYPLQKGKRYKYGFGPEYDYAFPVADGCVYKIILPDSTLLLKCIRNVCVGSCRKVHISFIIQEGKKI